MKSSDALRLLAELSASQWGMVTTAQAAVLGVERLDLSRLCSAGHLERLAQGVYRDAGAPSGEFEGLRAAWLAADSSRTAEQRLIDLSGGAVVMGESAASLHGVGDLPADRHELSTPIRRQSQRPEVSYRQRQLDPDDVTIAHGLPVTTIERTVADLVEARTDLSLVADVLRDAEQSHRLDTDRLADLLGPLAARNGLRKGDGAAMLDRLTVLAGLDSGSLAKEIARSETLSALVAADMLERFSHAEFSQAVMDPATEKALQGLNQSITHSVAQAIRSALEDLVAPIGEMPLPPELIAALTDIEDRVSLQLSTQKLLGSFGEEWAAMLASTDTGSKNGPLLDHGVITASRRAAEAETRG
jgi:hypothetical protein